MKRLVAALCGGALASACTTTSKNFYENPARVGKAALCRAYLEATDPTYRQDIATELSKRKIGVGECPAMVEKQNQAAAVAVALVAVGAAAAVCANNDGCGGGGYTPAADWDQFYGPYGTLVWACREVYSGRFTYESNCFGRPQTDWRWPGKYRV